MRSIVCGVFLALALPYAAPISAAPAATPVVVAVDASRSLRPAELRAAQQQLSSLLEQLPGDTPSGLLAFADDARWIRPVGTPLSDIPAALGSVEPYGQHTLLHDALFTAAEALDATGGVVLLVTDGVDENSATTVEDVSRRCESAGVSVVTLGLGRQQERPLRRIALLTRGTFLGPIGQVDRDAFVAATTSAAEARAAEREKEKATAAPPAAIPTPTQQPAVAEPASQPAGPSAVEQVLDLWPILLLILGFLAAAALLIALMRRRPTAGEDPRALALEAELRSAEERELQLALRDRPVATPDETAEIAIPRDLRNELPEGEEDEDRFEKTRVLAQRSLLMVKEPGAAIRSLVLRGERGFGVGRDAAGNTLRIGDPAMSGRHFKIVPEGEGFVLVDLGSTNGTYVNRERVRARHLVSGDTIHAGQVEFEFRTFDQPLN